MILFSETWCKLKCINFPLLTFSPNAHLHVPEKVSFCILETTMCCISHTTNMIRYILWVYFENINNFKSGLLYSADLTEKSFLPVINFCDPDVNNLNKWYSETFRNWFTLKSICVDETLTLWKRLTREKIIYSISMNK